MNAPSEDTAALSAALDELKATVAQLQERVRAADRENAALFGLALGFVVSIGAKPDDPYIGRAEIESALIRMAAQERNPVLNEYAKALLDLYRGGHLKEPPRSVARHLRLMKFDDSGPAADDASGKD